MDFQKELFVADKVFDIHRVKFVGTEPDNECVGIYHNKQGDFTISITSDMKIKGDFFGTGRIKVFADRKEAYEYAIENKKSIIKDIEDTINTYEARKYGICVSTADGVSIEHEIDEYPRF